MHTFDFETHVRRHNRRVLSATTFYFFSAAAAWAVTIAIVMLLTWVMLRIREDEVDRAAWVIAILIVLGGFVLETLRRVYVRSSLRRDARRYLDEGPGGSVSDLRMQVYLGSRQPDDSTSLGPLLGAIVLAGPYLTAKAFDELAARVTISRLALADADNLFDELGHKHAWVALADYTGRGPLLWILHQLELLWIRFAPGYPEMRIAADIAQNYFSEHDSPPGDVPP